MPSILRSLRFASCSIALAGAAIACALVFKPGSARAEDLATLLPYVIDNHDRVRAAEARLSAARNRAREALGAWYPTLSQTANTGHEKQFNDNGDDTSTNFNEWDISLTQLLWDFGSTNAAIDKARLQVEEARYGLIETRQSLILEAVTAYVNVRRAYQALEFAKQSEQNIREQTGLEEALVVIGSGFSTDVLQAKTQLAGAQARRAQNEGGLTNALNRYRAVFGRMPDNLEAMSEVPYPAPFLPTSLTQSVDISFESNPSLKNAILAADIAEEDVRIARADSFFPSVEGSAERKFKKNVGGTIGSEQETLFKVEATFDFNLGFTAVNTLKASKEDLSATTFTAADTRRNIEEQVRNAWEQLQTAQRTASHLNNQANIAQAFLELARNERQLGRRSLIDVLSGETNLINAQSDALSAETDVLLASYGLLAATGQLEYETLKQSAGINIPKFTPSETSSVPSVIPTPPASRIKPVEQGAIEPDITISSERSAAAFNALMNSARDEARIAGPKALGETKARQSATGAVEKSSMEPPSHPPENTFATTYGEVGTKTDDRLEVASLNPTDFTTVRDAPLAGSADMAEDGALVHSTPNAIDRRERERLAPALPVPPIPVDYVSAMVKEVTLIEGAELAALAPAPARVDKVEDDAVVASNNPFPQLFSFLEEAHQRTRVESQEESETAAIALSLQENTAVAATPAEDVTALLANLFSVDAANLAFSPRTDFDEIEERSND